MINTIQQKDALELLRQLPDKYVDIVITSPPYNIKWKNSPNHRSGMFNDNGWYLRFKNGYDTYNDSMPESKYQEWLFSIVEECLRVSKGLVWINHKTRYRDGVGIHPLRFLTFPLWSEIVWNQRTGRAINSKRFIPSHEYLLGFGRPHYWDGKNQFAYSVWDLPSQSQPNHPAPFPMALISPIIEAYCPPEGIVLDPFIGSGTTALAAIQLNRNYIGGDISPRYVEDAKKRLSNPIQQTMFVGGGYYGEEDS